MVKKISFNEDDNVIHLLLFLLCLVFTVTNQDFLSKISLMLLPLTVKMTSTRLKGPAVFVFVAVVFIFVIIVIYSSQSNERTMIRMPQIAETRRSFESSPSEVTANKAKPRLNVILLTLMSSGSTVVGNMFNLHPDVFYIYEPLHALRRRVYWGEWRVLNKSRSEAFRKDFFLPCYATYSRVAFKKKEQ